MTAGVTAHDPGDPRLFVFIGPDKSGSTFLSELLQAHPEVGTPPYKELFYFDRFYERGAAWYRAQFGPGRWWADVSHDYLFSDAAAERIAADRPDARLGVGIRNPYFRAVSAYRYFWYQGRTRSSFSEALRTEPELLDHGDYSRHLPRWTERFPADAFIFVDFDSFADGEEAFQRWFFATLGLDPLAELGRLDTNAARGAILPAPLMRGARGVASWLRALGLQGVVQRAKNVANSAAHRRSPGTVPVEPFEALPASIRDEVVETIARAARAIAVAGGPDLEARWYEQLPVGSAPR